jgi:hypothetical protein
MASQVHLEEVVKTKVPQGTRAALLAVALARGEKPAQLIRAAILSVVRQGGMAQEAK